MPAAWVLALACALCTLSMITVAFSVVLMARAKSDSRHSTKKFVHVVLLISALFQTVGFLSLRGIFYNSWMAEAAFYGLARACVILNILFITWALAKAINAKSLAKLGTPPPWLAPTMLTVMGCYLTFHFAMLGLTLGLDSYLWYSIGNLAYSWVLLTCLVSDVYMVHRLKLRLFDLHFGQNSIARLSGRLPRDVAPSPIRHYITTMLSPARNHVTTREDGRYRKSTESYSNVSISAHQPRRSTSLENRSRTGPRYMSNLPQMPLGNVTPSRTFRQQLEGIPTISIGKSAGTVFDTNDAEPTPTPNPKPVSEDKRPPSEDVQRICRTRSNNMTDLSRKISFDPSISNDRGSSRIIPRLNLSRNVPNAPRQSSTTFSQSRSKGLTISEINAKKTTSEIGSLTLLIIAMSIIAFGQCVVLTGFCMQDGLHNNKPDPESRESLLEYFLLNGVVVCCNLFLARYSFVRPSRISKESNKFKAKVITLARGPHSVSRRKIEQKKQNTQKTANFVSSRDRISRSTSTKHPPANPLN